MTPIDQLSAQLFVRPGSVVLDIGTLTGDHAAYYLRCGAAMVHGFEPLARNRDRIPVSLLRDPRFNLLPVALSDASGSRAFHVPAHNDGAGSLSREFYERIQRRYGGAHGEVHTVETRTLDELDLPRADFWKIDVEGSELAVLRGAEQTLRRQPPEVVELEIFSHDRKLYLATLRHLYSVFPHLWALGVTPARRLIHYVVTPESIQLPEFHQNLARAGTPHYYASTHDFEHWARR